MSDKSDVVTRIIVCTMTAGKLLVSCMCSIAAKKQNFVLNCVLSGEKRLNFRSI